MKIIVSAGGTGGHIYPALAIINKFRDYINSNFPNYKQNKYLYLLPKRSVLLSGDEEITKL